MLVENIMKTTTALGFGLCVVMAALTGCASSDTGTDDQNLDAPGADPDGLNDAVGEVAGDNAPTEFTTMEIPFPIDQAEASVNLAELAREKLGKSELDFGGAKVSINPGSTLTLTGAGVRGGIQYRQQVNKKVISRLEGALYAKAEANIQVDVTYQNGFQGATQPKEFKWAIGNPTEAVYNLKFRVGGAERTLPIHYSVQTNAVFGCSLKASGQASAHVGAKVNLDLAAGLKYENQDGGLPKLSDVSVIGTKPSDIVKVSPALNGGASYVTADGNFDTTATCYVKPELEIKFFQLVAFAAAMPMSIDAHFGAQAAAVQRDMSVDASLEANWALTRRVDFVAYGKVGFGTANIAKTPEFKLGSKTWEKPLATGTWAGKTTFSDSQ